MGEKLQDAWPEAFVSTASSMVAVSRAVTAGRLRKLASRLYTPNLTDAPETIVRRNLWSIVRGAIEESRRVLDACHAFDDPNKADRAGIRCRCRRDDRRR